MKNPWFVFPLLFLFFSLNSKLSFGADTISANQFLSGDQTIVSSGGDFELGFFKPGNSSNYYIGMWYGLGLVSEQTPVWVANRETPIRDRFSAELRISDGNLVLFNESQVPIWSTNISSSTGSSSVIAVLEDTGNLVLKDGPNSSTLLWQSLEHPSHTWLPGGKLSLDKRTNRSQLLTSWKNSEDPSPGLYSLELDPNGSNAYLIRWNRSEQYWSSGPWDETARIFAWVPEMRLNYIYNFSFVSNENESYFTYSLYNPAIVSRFIMDVSGQIKQLSWLESSKQWNLFWSQPRQQCEVYAFCGAFGSCSEKGLPFCTCLQGFQPKSQGDWNLTDYSGGCQRKTKLRCEDPTLPNAKEDKFLELPNMVLPVDPQSMSVGSNSECESTCLNSCSCTAYAYDSDGCKIWIGELLNLQQDTSNGETIFIRLAASESSSSSNNKGIIIGATAGLVGLILVVAMLGILIWRRRTIKTPKPTGSSLLAFRYRDLQNATEDFSQTLGEGGFGSVFKGKLPDSSVIAVKQLESSSLGEKPFRMEVNTIGTVQHVNLMRLGGFCCEGTKKFLVYDYMPKGSLDAHLFHEKNSVLDWKTRYQIALGIARGLTYLHEKCEECIINCDMKPENILLDSDLCPKVTDFGLPNLIGREFNKILTTSMKGTRCYLAPEWISGSSITAYADVYSYGMMLFEFVSGRRNSEESDDGKVRFFPTWAAGLVSQDGDVLSLLDPKLKGDAPVEEVSRICKVACWCIQDDETHRPSMRQVVQILERVLDVNLPPIPNSLKCLSNSQSTYSFFVESSSSHSS